MILFCLIYVSGTRGLGGTCYFHSMHLLLTVYTHNIWIKFDF